MRIGDGSSDVCSSDPARPHCADGGGGAAQPGSHPEEGGSGRCLVRAHGAGGGGAGLRLLVLRRAAAIDGFRVGHCRISADRKSVGEGKRVSGRVELGGRRIIYKKKKETEIEKE